MKEWNLGLLKIVNGKRRWQLGWLATSKANGETKMFGGLFTTDSDAVRDKKRKEREEQRRREDAELAAFAREQDQVRQSTPAKKTAAKKVPAPSASTWGNSGAEPARRHLACGQVTDDGTPCERPLDPQHPEKGCGISHTAAIRRFRQQTKAAARGVTPARKTATARKATPRKKAGGR